MFFTLWQSTFRLVFMSNDAPSPAIPVLHFKAIPGGRFLGSSAAGGGAALLVLQAAVAMQGEVILYQVAERWSN